MATKEQIAANRHNAELSSGPRTQTGKNISRMNACRHGLTGQITTMTDEDRAAHDQFSKAIMKDLAPDGAMEIQLAQRVATDSWRLNRISAIEDNIFALGQFENAGELCPDTPQLDAALTAAQVFTEQSKQLQLLSLYEQRLNRAVQKNLALLHSIQATRKAERAEAMRVAAELLQLSETNGLEYVPSKDGFVFSTAEIHAAIDLRQRLSRATVTNFRNFKPRTFDAKAA